MYCQNCGKEISDSVLFCPYCGTQKEQKTVICANCGQRVAEGAAVCPSCGAAMYQPQDNAQQNYQQPNYQQPYQQQPPYQPPYVPQDNYIPGYEQKSRVLAGILGILLGCFGVHNFYLGFTGKAIAQLLISVCSCFTLSVVSGIWGLIEGIMILTQQGQVDAKGVPLKD